MTTETILPELIGTLAALPEHTQKTIQAYGAACYRTALQSPEIQALRNVLATLAEDGEAGLYESEYDGRMYTLCQHCSYQDDVRPQHDESCPIMKARSALAAMEQ